MVGIIWIGGVLDGVPLIGGILVGGILVSVILVVDIGIGGNRVGGIWAGRCPNPSVSEINIRRRRRSRRGVVSRNIRDFTCYRDATGIWIVDMWAGGIKIGRWPSPYVGGIDIHRWPGCPQEVTILSPSVYAGLKVEHFRCVIFDARPASNENLLCLPRTRREHNLLDIRTLRPACSEVWQCE